VKNYCPKCRETTGLHEKGVCLWCDGDLVDADQAHVLDADKLRVLYQLRADGYATLTELAKLNYEAWGFKTANSCAVSVSAGWRRLGLKPFRRDHRSNNQFDSCNDAAGVAVLRSEPAKTGK
jgi:hypothetical protein